jgi:ferric-dicitrate binding protein FerR (iron transport regulator)
MSNTDKHVQSARDGGAENAPGRFVRMRRGAGGGILAAAAALLMLTAGGAEAARTAGGEYAVARDMSWKDGRLTVIDEPLLSVIDEMNRHSERKLKVDRSDPQLRKLLVSGQFRTGRPEVLVEYIRAAGIKVWVTRDSEGNITLRLRPESSQG